MKILFFLVAIANVALFMWEYKTGGFAPVTGISEQSAYSDQEQILLVSELKNAPQTITPAPVSEPPIAGNIATDEAEKSDLAPKSFPSISESIDKPVLEKSTAGDSNIIDAGKIEVSCYEVGPFANKKVYQTLVKQIKNIESEIKHINRDEQITFLPIALLSVLRYLQ